MSVHPGLTTPDGWPAALTEGRGPSGAGLRPLGWVSVPWIVFIVGGVVGSARFGEGVERLVWFGADVAALLLILAWRGRIGTMVAENPLLIAWPLLAITSAAWSLTPGISTYHGVQLLMTILIGFILRASLGLSGLLRTLFLSLLAAQMLSLVALAVAPRFAIGLYGEWLGIFPHKNVLGMIMALQAITAACLFLRGWHRPLTAAGFTATLLMLVLSRSATSLFAAAAGLAPLAVAFAWLKGARFAGFCAGLAVMLLGIVASVAVVHGAEFSSFLLDGLGKDWTLTGRTILWQFAIDQFWREPLVGIGYKAYWESGTTTAAYLHYTVQQKLWFFHNNFLDVAVAFGALGVGVFGAGMLDCLRRACGTFLRRPSYLDVWPILLCIQVTILACFENILFQNHSLYQVLLAAAMPTLVDRPEDR